jgi:hypothetical protein
MTQSCNNLESLSKYMERRNDNDRRIKNGEFPLPDWWEDCNYQIKVAMKFLRKYGGEVGFRPDDIPEPPANFVARTPSEVLLLVCPLPDRGRIKSVQREFNSWWKMDGNTMLWFQGKLENDSKHLCVIDGVENNQRIHWVAFDPETYTSLSVEQANNKALIDRVTPACVEILNAIGMFPDWPKSWDGKKYHYPIASAYRVRDVPWQPWQKSLCLVRWPNGRQIELQVCSVNSVGDCWSSPTIREL